ncbi:BTA121 domain-containing protein surface lipoprotein [Borrelia coriaceae]|uniref:Lipoprotein n=1 Tax=Borrelia coriaceae ATCC 43381 TaxID=1408429 RepID=W5SV75_9SPIR|nr:hypothetical protein [Borrelia coriaceae]AHH11119.1 Hypothetical protein BCO_0022300 [Borrelia coriaceae ATCC 43381]
MQFFKLLLLFIVLFCCCENKKHIHDLGLDYDFRDFSNSDADIGFASDYFSLENLLANFDLSQEERMAVRFLRNALTDPTIEDDVPDIHTYSDDEFYEFLVVLNASKTREAIADIVLTLKVRDEILDIIHEFADGHPKKDSFELQLAAKQREYAKILKIACSSNSDYRGAYLALKLSDCSEMFLPLRKQVYDILHKY